MLGFTQKGGRRFLHGCRLAAVKAADPQAVVGREPIGRVIDAGGERLRLCEGRAGFGSTMAARMDQGVGIGSLQLEPALPRCRGFLNLVGIGSAARSACASSISGNFGVGEKRASAGASTACASAARPVN